MEKISRNNSNEFINGELVENIDTGPDLEISKQTTNDDLAKFNGFMSEDLEL